GNPHTGYMVWRRNTDEILKWPAPPEGVDEVHIDKSGRYLFVVTEVPTNPPSLIEGIVHDLQTGTVNFLTNGAPDYNPVHFDVGHGIIVGDEEWTNRATYRSLATPHSFATAISFGNDWSLANHLSMRADDESRVLMSFYAGQPPGFLHGEIVQVALDGSQSVR